MRRIATILFLLVFGGHRGLAQQNAQFEATIYFEDAVGNRDSILVGYDTLATENLDPAFGETAIDTPFDPTFEVRAALFVAPEKLSKKIISPAEWFFASGSDSCYRSSRIYFFVWAKHQPVTLSWNTGLFAASVCQQGSFISNHWEDELVFPPYQWGSNPAQKEFCLAEAGNVQLAFTAEGLVAAGVTTPVYIDYPVAGQGEQRIWGGRFYPAAAFPNDYTPCTGMTSIDREKGYRPLYLFPNPARTYFSWPPVGEPIRYLWILDGRGRPLLVRKDVGDETIDVSTLPAGVYQVVLETEKGKRYAEKLMLMP